MKKILLAVLMTLLLVACNPKVKDEEDENLLFDFVL